MIVRQNNNFHFTDKFQHSLKLDKNGLRGNTSECRNRALQQPGRPFLIPSQEHQDNETDLSIILTITYYKLYEQNYKLTQLNMKEKVVK